MAGFTFDQKIFQKKFVSVVSGHLDKRRESLMESLGLMDHLMTRDNFCMNVIDHTDYSGVVEKLLEFKKDSMRFLSDSLKVENND